MNKRKKTFLIAPEPAPLGKVSTKDLKKTGVTAILTAAAAGGLLALSPILLPSSAIVITGGLLLKVFAGGAISGAVAELARRLSTNSKDDLLTKEPAK